MATLLLFEPGYDRLGAIVRALALIGTPARWAANDPRPNPGGVRVARRAMGDLIEVRQEEDGEVNIEDWRPRWWPLRKSAATRTSRSRLQRTNARRARLAAVCFARRRRSRTRAARTMTGSSIALLSRDLRRKRAGLSRRGGSAEGEAERCGTESPRPVADNGSMRPE